jgi:archaellum component FlaG (FlaF/FlaG flagellin family)
VSIVVKWKPSVSDDVKKYHLLRRDLSAAAPVWLLRDTFDAKAVAFTDNAIQLEVWYEYRLIAFDDSGNVSDSSNVAKARRKFLPGFAPVLKMQANQTPAVAGGAEGGVELTWEFEEPAPDLVPPGSYKFLIYRSIGNEKPTWYADVAATERTFKDTDVVKGVMYNYAVMVSYEAGQLGEVAPAKSVLVGGAGPGFKKEVKPDEKKTNPAKLELRGRGVLVPNGDTTPALADGTDYGRVGTGSVVSHVFLLKNSGDKALILPAKPVMLDGGDLTAWAIRQPEIRLNGGGSQEFAVEFRPNAEGKHSAVVKVTGEQPWSFAVEGVGVAEPEMEVLGKGLPIANQDDSPVTADDTDFGGVLAGGSETHIFTIINLGINPLRVEGDLSLEGDPAFSFGKKMLDAAIPAGGQGTFEVVFSPKETGAYNAIFRLASNDLDENPYTFRLHGVGSGPEIKLQSETDFNIENGAPPSTETSTDFGAAAVSPSGVGGAAGGVGVSRVFKIKNTGDRALNLTGKPDRVTISGLQAADFTIKIQPAPEVKPGGGEQLFTIEFKPSGAGVRTATVRIENDDSNEGTFEFEIQGTGN